MSGWRLANGGRNLNRNHNEAVATLVGLLGHQHGEVGGARRGPEKVGTDYPPIKTRDDGAIRRWPSHP